MEKFRDSIGWLALPYLFIVSALYHVGYWSFFDIDILNFLGLQDAINGLLFPILDNTNQILPAILISGVLTIVYLLISSKLKNFGKTASFLTLLVFLGVVVTVTSIIINYKGTNLFRFPFFVLIILISLKEVESRKEGFKDNFYTIGVLILIPLYSGYIGFANALDIMQGKKFQYIETSLLNNNNSFQEYEYLIYLGKGGEYFIFTTPDFKKNLIASQSDFKNLVINTYPIIKRPTLKHLMRKP